MKRAVGAVVVLLALPGKALGGAPPRVANVDEARAAHGAKSLPHVVAGGGVTVTPAEGLASITTTVTIHVFRGGPVDVGFPALFSERALNGRPFVRGTPSAGVVDAGADLAIDVSGLPAGTYRLPLRRGTRSIGTAVFRLYSPLREGSDGTRAAGPLGAIGRISFDSSNDPGDDSEPFVAVDPSNAGRIVSAGNVETAKSGVGAVNVTTTGGLHPSDWTQLTFPTSFALGAGPPDSEIPAGDPILAADDQGNMWAGGLSRCDPNVRTSQGHIFVNRISFPNNKPPRFQSANAAIPVLHPGGVTCPAGSAGGEVLQDKPQLTIDNWPNSPTRGRLYVTWDDPDPSGGTNVVMSSCDTRPSVTTCDTGAGWSAPVVVSDQAGGGSYISSDPAVGPDGTLYVVWWDYSATNAIRIDTCRPIAAGAAGAPCATFGTDGIVASLSSHFGSGVPFACPTMAQPGGRAAPVPSVAVDPQGRLYVAWGDLGTTGSVRCAIKADNSMTLPDANQDAFNAYVASGTYAALTADPAAPSGARGTNVVAEPGDHWFPWVAMDASTGKAAVALYSTHGDTTRRTANYYVRAIVPETGDTRVAYGPMTIVSMAATDYSDQACGLFGNDYGDYAGLAASRGFAIPAWDQRSAGRQGDVWVGSLPAHDTPTEAPADNPPLPPVTSEYLPQCAPPPPATTTTTTTTTSTTAPAPVDRKPPTLRVTFAARVDRRGRYVARLGAAGEPASGSVVLRTATGRRRTLASVRIATSGTRPLRLILRLKRWDFTALKRAGRLRVTVVVALTDAAGNAARRSKTLTLRPSRR